MAMKQTPKLAQIEIFAQKRRGGYRGAHRQKGTGSTVMRIPNDLLSAVTALIEAHKTDSQSKPSQETKPSEQLALSVVTELKPDRTQPYYDKYLNPKNPAEYWSGMGRIPMWVHAYLPANHKIPNTLLNPNPTMPITRKTTGATPC